MKNGDKRTFRAPANIQNIPYYQKLANECIANAQMRYMTDFGWFGDI